ncbi:MAG: hypothetical protein QM651_16295 [Rhodoblastus sp.]
MFRFFLVLALCLPAIAPAAAQPVPKLDYRKTCAETPAVGMDKKSTLEACLRDEADARKQLPPVWRKASPKARGDCLAETTQGGVPSYVELITCLEGTMSARAK